MPRSLCLIRQCLGLTTRIECEICPLAGGQGLWMLLCAAGRSAAQPSEIRAQGPFHGPFVVEDVLRSIAGSLTAMGYETCSEPMIWRLHLRAELRRHDAGRRQPHGVYQWRPER